MAAYSFIRDLKERTAWNTVSFYSSMMSSIAWKISHSKSPFSRMGVSSKGDVFCEMPGFIEINGILHPYGIEEWSFPGLGVLFARNPEGKVMGAGMTGHYRTHPISSGLAFSFNCGGGSWGQWLYYYGFGWIGLDNYNQAVRFLWKIEIGGFTRWGDEFIDKDFRPTRREIERIVLNLNFSYNFSDHYGIKISSQLVANSPLSRSSMRESQLQLSLYRNLK